MQAKHPVAKLDPRTGPQEEVDRYEGVTQYSRAGIVALWAATAGPMAILAWLVAPWLSHHLGGREPLGQALLICLNVGLLWILALTLILVRRERGSLRWPNIRDALWLRPPQSPKTRRIGGKVWWWVVPFVLLSAAINALPIDPTGPLPRDFPEFITTDRAEHFYRGAWGMFALTVLVAFLAPIVEELFFRGLLLPRMRTRVRAEVLGDQRLDLRGISPASTVEHAGLRARRRVRAGVPGAPVPQHLDQPDHAHRSVVPAGRHRARTRAEVIRDTQTAVA